MANSKCGINGVFLIVSFQCGPNSVPHCLCAVLENIIEPEIIEPLRFVFPLVSKFPSAYPNGPNRNDAEFKAILTNLSRSFDQHKMFCLCITSKSYSGDLLNTVHLSTAGIILDNDCASLWCCCWANIGYIPSLFEQDSLRRYTAFFYVPRLFRMWAIIPLHNVLSFYLEAMFIRLLILLSPVMASIYPNCKLLDVPLWLLCPRNFNTFWFEI